MALTDNNLQERARSLIPRNNPPSRSVLSFTDDELVLMEGVSLPVIGRILGITSRCVALRRARLAQGGGTSRTLESMTVQDGLALAQLRGAGHLPALSRMAILDYRKRGASGRTLANLFRCSLQTIQNVLRYRGKVYAPFSLTKLLTEPQRCPPAIGRGKLIANVKN